MNAAQAYVNRIRNPQKRAYARSVMRAYLRSNDAPDSTPFELSVMAAQAVRLHLHSLIRGVE
jgi:hypothetical protein